MSKLKDLTWEVHKQAERTSFARKLIKGLGPEKYYQYLYNQYLIYSVLETYMIKNFPEIQDICRSTNMHKDLQELETKFGVSHATIDMISPIVKEYERHVHNLDRNGLLAHVYVRHFGDMYGGQILKKRVPGSGKTYDFENREELEEKIRAMLTDEMADEAIVCFKFAIKLFEELDDGNMEHTDSTTE
jgi:heme oxygenase (biliverdin-producing, ferredoxin)